MSSARYGRGRRSRTGRRGGETKDGLGALGRGERRWVGTADGRVRRVVEEGGPDWERDESGGREVWSGRAGRGKRRGGVVARGWRRRRVGCAGLGGRLETRTSCVDGGVDASAFLGNVEAECREVVGMNIYFIAFRLNLWTDVGTLNQLFRKICVQINPPDNCVQPRLKIDFSLSLFMLSEAVLGHFSTQLFEIKSAYRLCAPSVVAALVPGVRESRHLGNDLTASNSETMLQAGRAEREGVLREQPIFGTGFVEKPDFRKN
ncbi:hypothetical protein C8F04DRAFT_1190555 [Mycena alexandri]|uniref:Uncharacterized protein n=1 Tax=Mycena alexandri TaxID=1745969 RepID=A0AAD6SHQ6_9AGAR|nr:hypothetical protein C8F04DRAFT_1190555 [Mycena alexandri]